MRPSRAVEMPRPLAKSGPRGITIMKSRMLTNWMAPTRNTSVRSETLRGSACGGSGTAVDMKGDSASGRRVEAGLEARQAGEARDVVLFVPEEGVQDVHPLEVEPDVVLVGDPDAA